MHEFARYEALGNDYIVIDPARTDLVVNAEVARALCDRHRGVGADGVLYGPWDNDGVPEVRVFNSDGSACGRSGNGLRIFARYLRENGHVDRDRFTIRTGGADVTVELIDPPTCVVAVDLGRYSLEGAQIPIAGPPRRIVGESLDIDGEPVRMSCVDVGTPHCVIEVDECSRASALRLGPRISRHAMFRDSTNVAFMVAEDRRTVAIDIWERGAGYTLASGASACAAAIVAHARGLVDAAVTVRMPGGRLTVDISADGCFRLTGETQPICTGTLAAPFRERLTRLAAG